jgi:hypothetical protein
MFNVLNVVVGAHLCAQYTSEAGFWIWQVNVPCAQRVLYNTEGKAAYHLPQKPPNMSIDCTVLAIGSVLDTRKFTK